MDESYEPSLTEQRTVYGLQLQVSPINNFLHHIWLRKELPIDSRKCVLFSKKSPRSRLEGLEDLNADD